MENSKNRMYVLKEEKVSTALLTLGIPTMIAMMVVALYHLVDAFFVGRLGTSQKGCCIDCLSNRSYYWVLLYYLALEQLLTYLDCLEKIVSKS